MNGWRLFARRPPGGALVRVASGVAVSVASGQIECSRGRGGVTAPVGLIGLLATLDASRMWSLITEAFLHRIIYIYTAGEILSISITNRFHPQLRMPEIVGSNVIYQICDCER